MKMPIAKTLTGLIHVSAEKDLLEMVKNAKMSTNANSKMTATKIASVKILPDLTLASVKQAIQEMEKVAKISTSVPLRTEMNVTKTQRVKTSTHLIHANAQLVSLGTAKSVQLRVETYFT